MCQEKFSAIIKNSNSNKGINTVNLETNFFDWFIEWSRFNNHFIGYVLRTSKTNKVENEKIIYSSEKFFNTLYNIARNKKITPVTL